ncbi:MAG: hypothetical protein HQL08_04745 [Nitrospirae bacterium]|nr:hypothetical protein [Nitrospirota bacterium]
MAIIPTNKLMPGMVLKSAVNDITGRLLLGKGVEIGQKHLTIFKTWGITEVDIEGDVEDDAVKEDGVIQVDEETLCKAREEVLELFAFTDMDNSTITKEIFHLSVQHKIDRLNGV